MSIRRRGTLTMGIVAALFGAAGMLGCSTSSPSSMNRDAAGGDSSEPGAGGIGAGGGGTGTGGHGAGTGGNTSGAGGSTAGTGGQSGGTGGHGAGGSTAGSGGAGPGGAAGSGGAPCKRGIAANTAPGAAFFPAVTWWYNWSNQGSGANTGIEFVPMIWGSGTLTAAIPKASKYLLGFNEPNFHAQSNLTAAQAAADWPMLETKATAAGIPLVSPGMNFCGPAADCNGTDPYQYLKDFFAACAGCEVDYIAVHWYNCDLPSLKDYLEPGGSLEGFEQFGKPIWLTEFSCDPTASVADQTTFMQAAIPYLEGNPNVFRYSWFSASAIPNAQLMNSDGSPTALGQVYINLPQSCQ